MGLNDAIKKTVDNITDKVNQMTHEGNADAEQATRDTFGDQMTPGEKVGSVANEAKERFLGGVDKAKQDVRND